MTKKILTETASGSLKETAGKPGLYEIKLIAADVQGSSGFYSRSVLERDGATAFPKNTKVFLDHPSADEAENRPERSVRHIAGYLTEDATLREDGLYGPVQFGRDYQTLIEDFHGVLGMSIRANGEVEESEDESGTIRTSVSAIYPGPLNSVDVVTAPGAQGAIVGKLYESFRDITETKETERNVPMDEKDIEKVVSGLLEGLKPAFVALAESLKPEAPQEDEVAEPDMAAVTESAIEAGLSKVARARVVASVKAGTSVEEAIKAEKDYTAEVLAEAGTTDESGTGRIIKSGETKTLAEKFDAIFPGGK